MVEYISPFTPVDPQKKFIFPLQSCITYMKDSLISLLCYYTPCPSRTIKSRCNNKQLLLLLGWRNRKLNWTVLFVCVYSFFFLIFFFKSSSAQPGAPEDSVIHSVSAVSQKVLFCLFWIHSLGLWWRLTSLPLLFVPTMKKKTELMREIRGTNASNVKETCREGSMKNRWKSLKVDNGEKEWKENATVTICG